MQSLIRVMYRASTPSTSVRTSAPRAQCRSVRSIAVGQRHRTGPPTSSTQELYQMALDHARAEAYEDARSAFEHLLSQQPGMCKAWVSYAQMEKRCSRVNRMECWQRCRTVLQRGLALNPTSSCLIQAWGLMELQRGNWWAAVVLLERCARLDPKCVPVLKWQHVRTAKKTVGSRSRNVATAATGGGGGGSSGKAATAAAVSGPWAGGGEGV